MMVHSMIYWKQSSWPLVFKSL